MKWNKTVNLTLRVNARQHADTVGTFQDVSSQLNSAAELRGRRQDQQEEIDPIDLYIPCKPEQVSEFKGRGLLVLEVHGRMCLVRRQYVYSLHAGDIDPEFLVELALKKCGPIFAVIEIVKSALTEVTAI